MSIESDIAGDYQHIEGVETVTLTPKNRTLAADTSVSAKRHPLRWREVQMAAQLGFVERAIAFSLFTATMGSIVPQPLDQITDSAGAVYAVQSVDKLTLNQRYRCLCARL